MTVFPRAAVHFGGRRLTAVIDTEPDRKDSTLSNEDFYILWEPTSALPPRRRFYSEDHAFAIAEKMAEGHPGKKFYVMHVVGVAKPQTVVVERFDRVTEEHPGGRLSYDPNGPIAKMPTAGPPDWEESATIHAAGFAPIHETRAYHGEDTSASADY